MNDENPSPLSAETRSPNDSETPARETQKGASQETPDPTPGSATPTRNPTEPDSPTPGPNDSPKEKKRKRRRKKKRPGLGSDRGVETMFRTSYRTHLDLSALADTKANIMISINGIVISIILASISPKIDANPWLVIPTSVLLVGCMASLIYAILSARPRVSSSVVHLEDIRQNRSNILFFGNFVSLSEDDYVTGMTELLQNTDQLYLNMIRDIYSLGAVLTKKFRLLRTSYTIFMWALILGVGLYLLVFAGVVTGGAALGSVIP